MAATLWDIKIYGSNYVPSQRAVSKTAVTNGVQGTFWDVLTFNVRGIYESQEYLEDVSVLIGNKLSKMRNYRLTYAVSLPPVKFEIETGYGMSNEAFASMIGMADKFKHLFLDFGDFPQKPTYADPDTGLIPVVLTSYEKDPNENGYCYRDFNLAQYLIGG